MTDAGRRRVLIVAAVTAAVVVLAIVGIVLLQVGGAPQEPIGTAEPHPVRTRAVTADGRFELVFEVGRSRYAAGEPIEAQATLTYLGPEPRVTLRGSGGGLVAFTVRQLNGPLAVESAQTADCAMHDAVARRGFVYPFVKSGGFSPEDPNAAFARDYLNDPELRLPSGEWELTATATFDVGDCTANPIVLQAPVRILVEP